MRREFQIGNRKIGEGWPCFVIAEAGLAHLGSLDLALQMVETAALAGADAYKIQAFNPKNAMTLNSGPRFAHRALSLDDIMSLKLEVEKTKMAFIVTPHDEWALDAVVRDMNLDAVKIGSGEKGNWPFIEKAIALSKPTIISTGGYTVGDISTMMEFGKKANGLAVLHCVSEYPMPPSHAKLNRISIIKTLGVVPGWSCHCAPDTGWFGNHELAAMAIALGAKVVERHIMPEMSTTISTSGDMKVASTRDVFQSYVSVIRQAEKAL